MNLEELQEYYFDISKKAGDVARQLAFAGIGVVWVFKTQDGSDPSIPDGLLIPLGLFALALAADLLQYTAATAVWGILQWRRERAMYETLRIQGINTREYDLDHPAVIKLPQFFFFIVKLISVLGGYVFLCRFAWLAWYYPGG